MPLQKSRPLLGLALLLLLVIYVPSASAGERRGAVITKITDGITDGDTVWVFVDSRRVKLRLLGIDTLEKYRGRKLRRDAARCGISEAAMVCLGKGGPAGPFLKKGDKMAFFYTVSAFGQKEFSRINAAFRFDGAASVAVEAERRKKKNEKSCKELVFDFSPVEQSGSVCAALAYQDQGLSSFTATAKEKESQDSVWLLRFFQVGSATQYIIYYNIFPCWRKQIWRHNERQEKEEKASHIFGQRPGLSIQLQRPGQNHFIHCEGLFQRAL
ncbi:MAG: hypothetical protein GWP10_06540 [Nitrospiraceae bacterium]|nr:hypothetical protein [Nitrospiraceae bacterium]